MLLQNIKPLTKETITEGVIPPHISMTLAQIVQDGGITNSVQVFILGGMLEMLKNGETQRWPRELNNYNMTVSSDLIDEIKSIPGNTAADFAAWVLVELSQMAEYEAYKCPMQPHMTATEYVAHVLSKQA